MGALADAAKENSKFLIVNKGESVKCQYIAAELQRSQKDPDKKVALFTFKTDIGGSLVTKYWNNGSRKILVFFDSLPVNSWVKITRGKWVDQDGKEDTQKSSYSVCQIDPKTGKEIAWDEEGAK